MRRILRLSLREAGFNVRFARNDADARRQLTERLPDVLIADIDMPSTDGPHLLAWLDDTWPSRAFPVVFITARARTPDQPLLDATNTLLLEKPFSVRRLLQELSERLNPVPSQPEVASDRTNAGNP